MSEPAVELRRVSLTRRGVPVLEEIDLVLDVGEYLAILGPNGSGKTTLLRTILGLVTPDRGRVRVFGEAPERARGSIGYVPQQARFDLDFPIRVDDVVLMGRLRKRGLLRRYTAEDRAVARDALARVEMLDRAHRPIGALSGGELQRVLIARALSLEPRLLLLDEPTANLDERVGGSFWDLIASLAEECTVVLVSHDTGAVARSVPSVACLNRRLFVHPSRKLTRELLETAYGDAVDALDHDHGGTIADEPGGA